MNALTPHKIDCKLPPTSEDNDSHTMTKTKLESLAIEVQSLSKTNGVQKKRIGVLECSVVEQKATIDHHEATIGQLQASHVMLEGEVARLTEDNSSLNSEVARLTEDNSSLNSNVMGLNSEVARLTEDKSSLNSNVMGLTMAMIRTRNRQLVRQTVFAYQLLATLEFGAFKNNTKKAHLATNTHKNIAKEAAKDPATAARFKEKVEAVFSLATRGNVNTTELIDSRLADIRLIGTDTNHPFKMYDHNMNEVLPTGDDLRQIIAELDDVEDDVKECATAALDIVLSLANGATDFLKST